VKCGNTRLLQGLIPRYHDINLIQRKSISRPQPAHVARIVLQRNDLGTRASYWPVLHVLHRRLLAIAEECPSGF